MSAHEGMHTGERPHPQSTEYVVLAVILGGITALEVAVYYQEPLRAVIIPILLVLSALKFALVVMFYMHLRFDHRMFSGFFVSGLAVAAFVIVTFITLFHFLRAPFPTG